MEKGDSLSLRTHAWCSIDQTDSFLPAAGEGVVQILNGKADVMDTRTAALEKLRDRRVWGIGGERLEELDELRPRREAGNAGTVGIVERMLVETEKITIEGKQLVDRAHGDSNVRYARSTTRSGWHENRAPYMV